MGCKLQIITIIIVIKLQEEAGLLMLLSLLTVNQLEHLNKIILIFIELNEKLSNTEKMGSSYYFLKVLNICRFGHCFSIFLIFSTFSDLVYLSTV
jgi:hypothetical protein